MKQERIRTIISIITAAFTLVLPILILTKLITPGREIIIHSGLALFIITLGIVSKLRNHPRLRRGVLLARTLLFIAWFLYILLRILIIPFNSYLLWFSLAEAGRAEGGISTLFTGLTLFFLTVSTLTIIGGKPLKGATGGALSTFFILTIIYRSIFLKISLIGMASFFGIIILYPLFRKSRNMPSGGSPPAFSLLPLGIILAASLILSIPQGKTGSPLIDKYLFKNLRGFVAERLEKIPLFELSPGTGYGYTFLSKGDRPILTSNALFLVEGEPFERYYLRENIYSTYKDGVWSNELEEYELPEFKTATENEKGSNIRITVLSDFSGSLISTMHTERIDLESAIEAETGEEREIVYKDGGMRANLPLVRGEMYRLIERQAESSLSAPPPPPPNVIFSSGEGILPGVEDLAGQFKNPGTGPLETAEKITSYLIRNYTYSLDTSEPEGDLAAHFLFYSREGYCTHFATSFILLFRACGFSARLASGYLAEMYRPENLRQGFPDPIPLTKKRVTGYNSHVWPEIWVPEVGWQTWEATPPLITSDFNQSPDRYTEAGLIAMGQKGEIPQTSETKGPLRKIKLPAPEWLFLTLILLTFSGLLFQRINNRRSVVILRRLVKSGRKRGIPSPEETGWREWSLAMGNISGRKSILVRTGLIAEKRLYSRKKEITARDRKFLLKAGTLNFKR
ncbi:MAG: transglutaminase domain-containing protein [Spirochaetales bacterium]|nr:transglutaminase domain-containing protein [Spirochaetales bacterium]